MIDSGNPADMQESASNIPRSPLFLPFFRKLSIFFANPVDITVDKSQSCVYIMSYQVPVAQLVEQVTLNHWVHGSSPCGRTI